MDADEETGPKRPSSLDFIRITKPGKPVVLQWQPPAGKVAGYVVYATENRFPPQMAGALFEGKMRQFIDEQRLDASAREYRVARAEEFYGMVWFDVDDNYFPVEGLCEPREAQEVIHDIAAYVGTQPRTYLRVKWTPAPVPMRDERVEIWVRDVEPNAAALNKMADGDFNPDFVLRPEGDGFIDTVSETEWRKHYVAVAVDRDHVRRPLRLEMGGFLRLEEPQYLERAGKKNCDELLGKVRDQIEMELQRRSVGPDDVKRMLKRADDLQPYSAVVKRLRRKAQERFGDEW